MFCILTLLIFKRGPLISRKTCHDLAVHVDLLLIWFGEVIYLKFEQGATAHFRVLAAMLNSIDCLIEKKSLFMNGF